MFDYANLRRPIIYFTYDYSSYVVSERGTYFDLAAAAPVSVTTTGEVVDALRRGDDLVQDYAEKYDAWVQRFGTYETGHAAQDVVKHVFGEDR